MKDEGVKQKQDLDFEIQFFEGVVRKQPNFIDALVALGDLYTKKGLFQKGLEIDRRLSELRPEDPFVFYNLACSYSLLQEIDKAFAAIHLAIQNGYDDFDYLMHDQDLENLRKDNRFQSFSQRFPHKSKERTQRT